MITVRLIGFCLALQIVGPGPASSSSSSSAEYVADNSNGNNHADLSSEPRAITYPCKCEESQCSCCSGNLLENFNLNFRQRICTNISYVPEDFEFNVRILFNDYTIYNRVVSGRNPRPICVPIFPPAWTRSRVCLKFSDVYFVGRNVHVCMSMEAQTEKRPVLAFNFNCVRMGTAGVALLKPEDGGGLPAPPVPQDPTDDTQAIVTRTT
ncbi:Domain of unknown function DUF4773 [Cinara cedri]|uniref:DUF4773 domain-containing protein n=1 Tax=Cinara cedri TaxID=506608 RepID=A0A5E4MW18_9HEMI|nr:Domain of unknown function DUF4773 [Cinara cedri]